VGLKKKIKNMIVAIPVILIVLIPIVILWVRGIDFMSNNHPDYKGNDLFGEFDEDDKNCIL
jgi:hypothetical protein